MRKNFFYITTLVLFTVCSSQASATSYDFVMSGGGISGHITLTYGTATDAKYSQAYEITGITGTFSDSTLNILNASILGLEQLNRATPESTNLLAPNDFSAYAVASGLPPQEHGHLHYDNLFYPGGSPQTASDYPGHGGFLDIYGLLFDIDGNRVVNLWSSGVASGSTSADYGAAVVTPSAAQDYVGGGISAAQTPEPGTLCLLSIGLIAVVSQRRRFRR